MQASKEFLYGVFDAYNRRCFGGTLKRPVIVTTNAKRTLGAFYPTHPVATIKVSNYYDRSEADFVDTMVHEMIHYHIYATGMRDTSSHGKLFRSMMDEINRREQLHMSVRANAQKWQPSVHKARIRDVLFLKLSNGRHYISAVSPRHVNDIERQLIAMGAKVEMHQWYVTNHADYQSLSIVRTLRGTLVSEEEFNRKKEEMDERIKGCRNDII